MKMAILNRTVAVAIVLSGVWWLSANNVRADLEVSADVQINAVTDFEQPLAANGVWLDVGAYGRCWYPGHVEAGWRPYCDGTWVWTDCGWYWQSDEPWGWACYHYGTWVLDSGVGWVWIPGIEWAPAWVYWREGGGHIGWAPCGPRGAAASDASFVFVEENHFQGRHRPSDVIVNNTTIINNTTVVNANNQRETRNINGRQQTVMVNNGPDVNNLEKVSGRKIQAVPIHEAAVHTVAPRSLGHKTDVPQENQKGNVPAPANHNQPMTAPEHKTPPASVPEIPNQPSPPDKRLPGERPDMNPPRSSSTPEVPFTPQPSPAPQPKHDEIVPPPHGHDVIPPHEPPPQPVVPQPKHEEVAPPPHEHEVVPPHEPAPHETQPVHPSAPAQGEGNNKDKNKDKPEGHDQQ
jgi:hypothetical protein